MLAKSSNGGAATPRPVAQTPGGAGAGATPATVPRGSDDGARPLRIPFRAEKGKSPKVTFGKAIYFTQHSNLACAFGEATLVVSQVVLGNEWNLTTSRNDLDNHKVRAAATPATAPRGSDDRALQLRIPIRAEKQGVASPKAYARFHFCPL